MDELLGQLVVGLVKLIVWVITGVFRLIATGYRKFVAVGMEELQKRQQAAAAEAEKRSPAGPRKIATASVRRPPRLPPDVATALRRRAEALASSARALSALAAERSATERFGPTLDAIVERATATAGQARRGDAERGRAQRELERDETLAQIVADMIGERRTPGLADLLADTDALATASYAPIVEYCADRRIALSSDRAATVVGGDKIYFLSVDDPTGLAAIVLPDSFREEIIAWPAIAHEIAHDFYRSVAGLPDQLRRALGLGGERSSNALPRFDGDQAALSRALAEVPARATAAWQEELFADAFGTMMLGPAYVETMAALFARPDDPAAPTVIAAVPGPPGDGPRYEEHPPGHVRVVAACRLLGKMGYGKIGDGLERRWRKRHRDPDTLYAPLADGRYALLPEGPAIERAATVGDALYLTGLPCLRGQPLRSIPGLDFGPREHLMAERVADQLVACRPVRATHHGGDARLLVAGAVLATLADPDEGAGIYALARDAIDGLPDRAGEAGASSAPGGGVDAPDIVALREAFVLRELLGPPRSAMSVPVRSRRAL